MRPATSATIALALALLPVSVVASYADTGSNKKMAKPAEIKAVVELFTSQGCSSCPPADRLLQTYVKRKDVIALTLPVTYWDNLGWKDTLASPRNTKRQYAYASARGDGNVYTPQMVINGMHHVVGSRKREIDKAITQTSKKLRGRQVPVKIWAEGKTMIIEASAAAPGTSAEEATIWLATIKKHAPVKIKRGENRNRKIVYHNVVRDLSSVGMWNGKAVRIKLARHAVMNNDADGCIVFLQQGHAGPIIGAAELKHW